MARGRYVNVVVAPEDRTGVISLRLRYGVVYTFAVMASLFVFGVIGVVLNQAMDEAKLTELKILRYQNGMLKEKVRRLAAIEKKVTELEVIEDKLMVIAGEREATRELEPIAVEAGKGGTTKPVGIAESLTEFRTLTANRRGVLLNAPAGDPVANGWIARGFGETGLEGTSFHNGVDIAAPAGTPVRATAEGVVIFAAQDPIYGNLIIIQHGLTGYSSFYGHLSSIKVRKGATVKRGEVIGAIGTTGRSTAPHLHYEVRLHGVPVNALKFLTPPTTAPEETGPAAAATAETAARATEHSETEGGIPHGEQAKPPTAESAGLANP